MMIANLEFYPVGQGCFYAGAIKSDTKEFVIVYDCGTVSTRSFLKDSIIKFKNEYKKIDLLIVSHFDEDHVNGLKELLTGIACEKVIIPYYEPIVRLTLLINENLDNDYISFIRDPVSYLLNTDGFRVTEVIILRNGGEGGLNNNLIPIAPIEPSSSEINEGSELSINIDEKNDEKFREYVKEKEKDSYNSSDKIKYFSLPFRLKLSNESWEFIFYLKDFKNPSGLTGFKSGIDKLISKTKDNKLTSLFDEVFIPNIKSIYKKYLFKNINYTSLSVYHGPVKTCHHLVLWCNYQLFHRLIYSKEGVFKSGTLLTGDSFLKEDEDFDPFITYYSNYIEKCFLFQVPHHGSQKNWKPLPNGLEDIPVFVINHGLGRKKHPSKSVVDNIMSHSTFKDVISNNQTSNVCYKIILT